MNSIIPFVKKILKVYVKDTEAGLLLDTVDRMKVCFPFIKNFVTFHIVYPAERPLDFALAGDWAHVHCDELLRLLRSWNEEDNNVIPVGLLRNIARSAVLTDSFLMTDIQAYPRTVFESSGFLDPLF